MTIIWKETLSKVSVTIHALLTEDSSYIYLIVWDRKAICVDPPVSEPVFRFLEEEGLELAAIFITHEHKKHKIAVQEILKRHDVNVVGPEGIDYVQQVAMRNDELIFGPFFIKVFSMQGYSPISLAYYFSENHLLFCGEILSGGGCGYAMNGTIEQLFSSLKTICYLPQDTELFFMKEETLKNLQFAKTIDADNPKIEERIEKESFKQSQNIPTSPSKLADELLTNPFLRCKNANIKAALQLENTAELDVFLHIYKLREKYASPKES